MPDIGKCPHRWGKIEILSWRLESLSARTTDGPLFTIEYQLPSFAITSKENKTYRNPLIYAMELAEEMKREGLTQADLARRQGISRARVNQWLSLLRLPERDKRRIQAMGDDWNRRLITERSMRKTRSE